MNYSSCAVETPNYFTFYRKDYSSLGSWSNFNLSSLWQELNYLRVEKMVTLSSEALFIMGLLLLTNLFLFGFQGVKNDSMTHALSL